MKIFLIQLLMRVILTLATLVIMLGACLAIALLHLFKWTRWLLTLLKSGRTPAVVSPVAVVSPPITPEVDHGEGTRKSPCHSKPA